MTEYFLKVALLGSHWVMYILCGCSVISIAFILERCIYFFMQRANFGKFIQQLSERLNSTDDLKTTAAWCSGQNFTEAQIATAGLNNLAVGNLRSAEEAMNVKIITYKINLERGLTVLGTLGSNAPFIGLLGTVIGVVQAFHALGSNTVSQTANTEAVMSAVSESLVATAFGLLVAIPAMLAHNFFWRLSKIRLANADVTAKLILSCLSCTKKTQEA